MEPSRIRIGNQTSSDVPARLPFEFTLRRGFDAFEWLSDRGRAGWCESLTDVAVRRELRAATAEHGVCLSVHAPWAADPARPEGAAAIRRSLDFAADVIKSEILDKLLAAGNEIAFVVDDRPSVVAMWRDRGLFSFPGQRP